MPLLVAQADYNIAYLYYLRGEYTRALELYRAAQEQCERLGDAYHSALCDLDRSEIYLELNLSDEAADLARRALARFDELGMVYEAAKAVTNLAHRDEPPGRQPARAADCSSGRASSSRSEDNQVWLALVDFYQALVLYRDGQARARAAPVPARARAVRARIGAGKGALCELLLARLELEAGDLAAAERACRAALRRSTAMRSPILMYQAHFVLGLIREAQRDQRVGLCGVPEGARRPRTPAQPSPGRRSESRVPERQAGRVREPRVDLPRARIGPANARKRRSATSSKRSPAASPISSRFAPARWRRACAARSSDEVRRLRQQLNWHYRQIELEEVRREKRSLRRIETLRLRARTLEKQLSRRSTRFAGPIRSSRPCRAARP